jgi:hypothetical protein
LLFLFSNIIILTINKLAIAVASAPVNGSYASDPAAAPNKRY